MVLIWTTVEWGEVGMLLIIGDLLDFLLLNPLLSWVLLIEPLNKIKIFLTKAEDWFDGI